MSFAEKAKARPVEEKVVEHLCSTCRQYATRTFRYLGGRPALGPESDHVVHQCDPCYERTREKTLLDLALEERLRQWGRRDTESLEDYRARVMTAMKGMRGPRRVVESKSIAPADERYFEGK